MFYSFLLTIFCVIISVSGNAIMPDPPSPFHYAEMARYIVHYSNWTSLSFTETDGKFKGYPSSRIFSMSDGAIKESTGIPQFYATAWDQAIRDLKTDNRCSLSMSLAQIGYCQRKGYDPESPLCAQVVLTGKFETLKENSYESTTAEKALLSRHPEMKMWPKGHNFRFHKLNIEEILLLDFFGGIKTVPLDQYFKVQLKYF